MYLPGMFVPSHQEATADFVRSSRRLTIASKPTDSNINMFALLLSFAACFAISPAHKNMRLMQQNKALLKALRELTQAKEVAVGSLGCDSDSDCDTGEKCIHDWFMGDVCQIQTAREQAVGADPCDEYCEDWEDFKKGKLDKDETTEEICGYYKSERCKTCAVVQFFCGWKKITEAEDYSYTTVAGGKCRTLAGADPKFSWKEDRGHDCEELCNEQNDCFGYSISEPGHCLLWLQRDIMGGGDAWGGASCHIKDISCEGNVGYDYNCWECFGNGKYLWGNTCLAKELGKDSYLKGKCGLEYKCFTDGESIGDCPYDTYCPSV